MGLCHLLLSPTWKYFAFKQIAASGLPPPPLQNPQERIPSAKLGPVNRIEKGSGSQIESTIFDGVSADVIKAESSTSGINYFWHSILIVSAVR